MDVFGGMLNITIGAILIKVEKCAINHQELELLSYSSSSSYYCIILSLMLLLSLVVRSSLRV